VAFDLGEVLLEIIKTIRSTPAQPGSAKLTAKVDTENQ